jgi:hypothetical protein
MGVAENAAGLNAPSVGIPLGDNSLVKGDLD